MVKHVDTLGLLFVVWGVLQMAIGVVLALIYVLAGGAMGAMGSSTGDDEMAIMGVFMGGIGLFAACTVLVFSVPNLLVGAGLRRRAGCRCAPRAGRPSRRRWCR